MLNVTVFSITVQVRSFETKLHGDNYVLGDDGMC